MDDRYYTLEEALWRDWQISQAYDLVKLGFELFMLGPNLSIVAQKSMRVDGVSYIVSYNSHENTLLVGPADTSEEDWPGLSFYLYSGGLDQELEITMADPEKFIRQLILERNQEMLNGE